jgi:hypothetical protein
MRRKQAPTNFQVEHVLPMLYICTRREALTSLDMTTMVTCAHYELREPFQRSFTTFMICATPTRDASLIRQEDSESRVTCLTYTSPR